MSCKPARFLFLPVLALALAAPAGEASAKWRGISAADSRIVYVGRGFDAYRSAHHYLPFEESAYEYESYRARWAAPGRRIPVLWLRLNLLAPGRYYPAGTQPDLEEWAKSFAWFRGKPFSTERTGKAEMAAGTADYTIFAAGEDRCAAFRVYFEDNAASSVDKLGTAYISGLYCPPAGAVVPDALGAVLARIGVRGLAVQETGARAPARPAGAQPEFARLVVEGDMDGLRRAAAGFDPDRVIAFSHPRIAGGREIHRPILAAAALHGHTEMVAFLLDRGASTAGAGGWAICGAVIADHGVVVDLILEKDPAAARYRSCGRRGNMTPLALAERLDRADIAGRLRAAGG